MVERTLLEDTTPQLSQQSITYFTLCLLTTDSTFINHAAAFSDNELYHQYMEFLALSIPFWHRHMFDTVGFIQSLKLLFIPIVACLVTNHLKIWNTIIMIYLNDEIKLIYDLPFPPLSSFSALWGDSRYWGLEILVNIQGVPQKITPCFGGL